MHVQQVAGEPFQLGVQHGAALAETIRRNVRQLLGWHRDGNAHCLAEAEAWVAVQARRHFAAWPWLAEELRGIATGSNLPYEQIERMNFRIWQIRVELARRGADDELVNNTETAFATVALPQASPPCLWIAERPVTATGFQRIALANGNCICST